MTFFCNFLLIYFYDFILHFLFKFYFQASVHIQAKAEQEEEFISNTLLKKIQALKKEKENLALNYEQEEECLTNDLSRKLNQVILVFFYQNCSDLL